MQNDNIKATEDINALEDYFKRLRETNRSRWCEDYYCTQLYDKFE